MIALIGYALLSLITAIILSPIIKFGKGFSTYLCVFGMVFLVLLFISPTSYFEPNFSTPRKITLNKRIDMTTR